MGEMAGLGGFGGVVVGDLVEDVLLVGVDAGQRLALEEVGVVVLALEMHAVPNYIAPLAIFCGLITPASKETSTSSTTKIIAWAAE